jgi:hypothetical protein
MLPALDADWQAAAVKQQQAGGASSADCAGS